jgi:hypothetical protein
LLSFLTKTIGHKAILNVVLFATDRVARVFVDKNGMI